VRAASVVLFALTVAAPVRAAHRTLAIGDVHGDLDAFRGVLRAAQVIDANDSWVGGDAVVFQLGDLVDRGPQARGALDLARALVTAAERGGGRFVPLLGNHEVMNLVGDLRYVTAANYAEFAGADAEKRREEAWSTWIEWRKRRAARRGEPFQPPDAATREEWLQSHPPGYFEHCAAFGPDGEYGRWLRGRPAIFEDRATVFVHGGIAPSRIGSTLAEIDRQVHEEIAAIDELRRGFVRDDLVPPCADLIELIRMSIDELARLDAEDRDHDAPAAGTSAAGAPSAKADLRARLERLRGWSSWSIFSADGPLWFRGYSKWSDAEGAEEMPKLLAAYGVERFVVGHTPQSDRSIHCRFSATACLVDTGMLSSYFHGRGSSLEIADGALTAIYSDTGRQRLDLAAADSPVPDDVTDRQASPPAGPETDSTGPAKAPAAPPPASDFRGPDGKPLPFADDDELLAWLRDADVVEVREIGEGITRPRRLTLEKDGVTARVVFRNVSERKPIANVGPGRRETNLRDFYGYEPVAYRLSRLLGLDRIPPAELYSYLGEKGSIQIWIEKAMNERRRRETNTTPPDSVRWKRQLQTMLVWNEVVGNTDPNMGNILYGPNWEIYLIDHTRAFRQSKDLLHGEEIDGCPRRFYERLRTVSDDEIRAIGRDLLNPGEIRGLLARRARIVELLDRLVRERGEAAVLFDDDAL